jgi:hypothetical protein
VSSSENCNFECSSPVSNNNHLFGFLDIPAGTDLIHSDEIEAIDKRELIASSLAYSKRSDSVYQYLSPAYRANPTACKSERYSFNYSIGGRFPLAANDVNLSDEIAGIFIGWTGLQLELKLPAGNEFWLVKLDGNWYFTGRSVQHID